VIYVSLLPYLQEVQNPSKKYSVMFRGINYGEGTQDGEFAETVNLSTDKYPCITQRAERILRGSYTRPTTLHSKGELLVIHNVDDKVAKVFYGDTEVGTVTAGKKQTATVGNFIVIFPDKKYYNVQTKVFGDMEATYEAKGLVFTKSTITTTGDDFPFKDGDGLKISGCSNGANNKTIIVREVKGKEITFYDNSFTAGTEDGLVTIKREVPNLDFICESNYRLWGTMGNTIFASKFSDPLNFFVYDGLSSDSYYIDVGSDGAFTGCMPYSSHICFFKENTLHKLYGSKPSNFQISTANVYGVQSGSERSMQIVNEQLIYKGVGGVYAYTGGVPELISEKLGNKRFSDAVATCDGEKYYISMKQGEEWSLFTYDVMKEIWLREDDTQAVDMAFHNGKVYFLDAKGGLYYIDKTADRSKVEWEAVFCTINETMNERKGYSKFHLRVDLDKGAWLAVDVKTDNEPKWKQIFATHNPKAKTISIPIIPTRCDSVDIRLRGKGGCTVKTFIREFTVGSDV